MAISDLGNQGPLDMLMQLESMLLPLDRDLRSSICKLSQKIQKMCWEKYQNTSKFCKMLTFYSQPISIKHLAAHLHQSSCRLPPDTLSTNYGQSQRKVHL